MSTFAKAKRFTDIISVGPDVGAYDPKITQSNISISFPKSDRFKETIHETTMTLYKSDTDIKNFARPTCNKSSIKKGHKTPVACRKELKLISHDCKGSEEIVKQYEAKLKSKCNLIQQQYVKDIEGYKEKLKESEINLGEQKKHIDSLKLKCDNLLNTNAELSQDLKNTKIKHANELMLLKKGHQASMQELTHECQNLKATISKNELNFETRVMEEIVNSRKDCDKDIDLITAERDSLKTENNRLSQLNAQLSNDHKNSQLDHSIEIRMLKDENVKINEELMQSLRECQNLKENSRQSELNYESKLIDAKKQMLNDAKKSMEDYSAKMDALRAENVRLTNANTQMSEKYKKSDMEKNTEIKFLQEENQKINEQLGYYLQESQQLRDALDHNKLEFETVLRKQKDQMLKESEVAVDQCMKEISSLDTECRHLADANAKLSQHIEARELEHENEITALKNDNFEANEKLTCYVQECRDLKNKIERYESNFATQIENYKHDFMEKYGDQSQKIKEAEFAMDNLIKQMNLLQVERDNFSALNVQLSDELKKFEISQAGEMGHHNHRQKIKHLLALKDENLMLSEELNKCKLELKKKSELAKLYEEKVNKLEGRRRFDPKMAFKNHHKEVATMEENNNLINQQTKITTTIYERLRWANSNDKNDYINERAFENGHPSSCNAQCVKSVENKENIQ